jgi:hypothetical protein
VLSPLFFVLHSVVVGFARQSRHGGWVCSPISARPGRGGLCQTRRGHGGGAVGVIEGRDEEREKKKKKKKDAMRKEKKKLKYYNEIIILIKMERV